MSNSVKVILISQAPLPFSKIGSWTTLYKNYLLQNHKIDCIVCHLPEKTFDGIKYSFVKSTLISKFRKRILKKKNTEYLQALDKLIQSNEKYIFQIVDNYGMVKPLKNYLISKRIDKQSYIQFFYHGYLPHNQKDSEKDFYGIVDEIVVLTKKSYDEHKKQINILPNYFSILPNGIDTEKFAKISDAEKISLKERLNLKDKKVFVWSSNDRPKKGLNLILDVWKTVYPKYDNIALLVIGCDARAEIDGVSFLGKVPNDELPQYYQVSDCYLFPTLCQEGFGLSLIEALHCGSYCIASAMGGVPEVLQYGKFGKLIENPHFVSEWENAIRDFLDYDYKIHDFSADLYTMENWNNGMNVIIEKAKFRLHSNLKLI